MCAKSDILGNWFEFEIVFNARNKVNLKETIPQIRIIRLRNVYSQRYIENIIYGLSLFCIEKTKR